MRWGPTPAADRRPRTPRQPDRVALVGLDPITRPTLDVARRTDRHLDPLRARPPDQAIAGRARLIDRPRRPRQPRNTSSTTIGRPTTRRVILPGCRRRIPPRRSRARERPARPNAYRSAWSAPSIVWSRPRAQSSTCRTPRNAATDLAGDQSEPRNAALMSSTSCSAGA
jgi:hypothetical protein